MTPDSLVADWWTHQTTIIFMSVGQWFTPLDILVDDMMTEPRSIMFVFRLKTWKRWRRAKTVAAPTFYTILTKLKMEFHIFWFSFDAISIFFLVFYKSNQIFHGSFEKFFNFFFISKIESKLFKINLKSFSSFLIGAKLPNRH